MATVKQQKVARQIADNLSGKNKMTAQNMLENAGYGQGVAKTPKRVIRSKGVREELKTLGFDEETARKEVGKILTSGNNSEKLMAAREVFKVWGSYAAEKKEFTVNADLDEAVKRINKLMPD